MNARSTFSEWLGSGFRSVYEANICSDDRCTFTTIAWLVVVIVFGAVCSQMWAAPLTPGNILVTQYNHVLEYTLSGELVQEIPVPHPDTSRRDATDIVVSEQGFVYVFNIAPFDKDYISVYDPFNESWRHHYVAAQSGGISDGDLSLMGNTLYVRATAINMHDYSTTTISIPGRGISEISAGYDGRLYVVNSGSPANSIRILDAETFEIVNQVTVFETNYIRGIAADGAGQIYVTDLGGNILVFDKTGKLQREKNAGTSSFYDLDLSAGGRLAGGTRFGEIAVTDTLLESVNVFSTRGSEAYVCFVPEWPLRIVSSLEIAGPNEVVENSEGQYCASVHYDNGDSVDVTSLVEWSLSSETYASIDDLGKLTTQLLLNGEHT